MNFEPYESGFSKVRIGEWIVLFAATTMAFSPFEALFSGVDTTKTGIESTSSSYVSFTFILAVIWVYRSFKVSPTLRISSVGSLLNCFPLFSMLLIAILSFAYTGNIYSTFKQTLLLLENTLLAATLVGRLGSIGTLRLLVFSLFVISSISAFVAIADPQNGIHQPGDAIASFNAGRWRGVYSHKNLLAQIGGMLILISIAGFNDLHRSRYLVLVALVLGFVIVVEAGSASVIINTGMGLFFLTFLKARSIQKGIIVGALLILGIYFTLSDINPIDLIASMVQRDTTFTGRTNIWSFVLTVISKNWIFGRGYGNMEEFRKAIQHNFGDEMVHSHNAYLEAMVGNGILGLLPYSLIAFKLFRLVFSDPDLLTPAQRISTVIVFCWLLAGLTEAPTSYPNNAFFFCGITAFLIISNSLRARPVAISNV